jgi:hypothetical protein
MTTMHDAVRDAGLRQRLTPRCAVIGLVHEHRRLVALHQAIGSEAVADIVTSWPFSLSKVSVQAGQAHLR